MLDVRIGSFEGLVRVFAGRRCLVVIAGDGDVFWMKARWQRWLLNSERRQMIDVAVGEEVRIVQHDHTVVATCRTSQWPVRRSEATDQVEAVRARPYEQVSGRRLDADEDRGIDADRR